MVARYVKALRGCLIAAMLPLPAQATDSLRQYEFYQYVLNLQHQNKVLTQAVHRLQQQNIRLQWDLKYGKCPIVEGTRSVPARRSEDGANPRSWGMDKEDNPND